MGQRSNKNRHEHMTQEKSAVIWHSGASSHETQEVMMSC